MAATFCWNPLSGLRVNLQWMLSNQWEPLLEAKIKPPLSHVRPATSDESAPAVRLPRPSRRLNAHAQGLYHDATHKYQGETVSHGHWACSTVSCRFSSERSEGLSSWWVSQHAGRGGQHARRYSQHKRVFDSPIRVSVLRDQRTNDAVERFRDSNVSQPIWFKCQQQPLLVVLSESAKQPTWVPMFFLYQGGLIGCFGCFAQGEDEAFHFSNFVAASAALRLFFIDFVGLRWIWFSFFTFLEGSSLDIKKHQANRGLSLFPASGGLGCDTRETPPHSPASSHGCGLTA